MAGRTERDNFTPRLLRVHCTRCPWVGRRAATSWDGTQHAERNEAVPLVRTPHNRGGTTMTTPMTEADLGLDLHGHRWLNDNITYDGEGTLDNVVTRMQDALAVLKGVSNPPAQDREETRRVLEAAAIVEHIERVFPKVWAYAVVKVYSGRSRETVWPGCAFFRPSEAQAWRDFLDAYYGARSDDNRWPRDTWKVEYRLVAGEPDQFRNVGKPLGTGYTT